MRPDRGRIGQADLVLPATVGHHTPEDQAPDHHPNTKSGQPGAVPEVGDPAALVGHAVRQQGGTGKLFFINRPREANAKR